ncbi:MAG: SAM-dependent methyltransferase [Planctomycetota bacterium]
MDAERTYVGRGGQKLAFALQAFAVDPRGAVVCDLGSHIGGFVDCWLRHGAARVYAVDTAYGTFDWRLRNDPPRYTHGADERPAPRASRKDGLRLL